MTEVNDDYIKKLCEESNSDFILSDFILPDFRNEADENIERLMEKNRIKQQQFYDKFYDKVM